MDKTEMIFGPVIQAGFAGFSIVLLGIVIWLIRTLTKVLHDTHEVINRNTETIQQVMVSQRQMRDVHIRIEEMTTDIRDRILSRPCIVKREG